MIRYFLSVKCSNENCANNKNSSTFWYDSSTTAHPCGSCGAMITDCEVLNEVEFEEPLAIITNVEYINELGENA